MQLVFGIGFILVFISFALICFSLYRAERFKATLIVILFLGLFLRVFVASDTYLHEWDERFHALVAKNILDNPGKPMLYADPILGYDYKNWSSNHVWLHKQPLSLYLISLSIGIFGPSAFAVRIPSILLSLLAVYCTYKITEKIFNAKSAVLAAFLHSIHGLTIELVGGRVTTDHVDILFQVFIEVGILMALYHSRSKKTMHFLAMGLLTSFAVLTKWLPGLIVIPVWLSFLYYRRTFSIVKTIKLSIILGVVILFLVLPWQLYTFLEFPIEARWESQYNTRHFFEVIEGHGHGIFYHIDKIRIVYGEFIYLPMIWLIILLFKADNKYLFLGVWILIPLIFFSMAKTKMQGYMLMSSPAFFILSAEFYFGLVNANRLPNILRYILYILIIALPIRYSMERVKPFSSETRNPAWVLEQKELSQSLSTGNKYVLFNEDHPINAMYFCENLVAYSREPNVRLVDSLQVLNYVCIEKKMLGDKAIYKLLK